MHLSDKRIGSRGFAGTSPNNNLLDGADKRRAATPGHIVTRQHARSGQRGSWQGLRLDVQGPRAGLRMHTTTHRRCKLTIPGDLCKL